MADSVAGVITSAARRIAVVPEEQDIPDYVNQRGLEILNDILDEWSISRIYVPYQSVLTLNLVANQEAYTIGNNVAYNLNANAIVDVLQMNINDSASPGVDYPMLPPMTEQVYSNIAYKQSTGIPAQYILRLYTDYSELRFQPLPFKVLTAKIVAKQRLSRVALADDLSAIPREYTMGLKYKLAINLAQVYSRPLNPIFLQLATTAINTLESSAVVIDYTTRRDEQINRRNIVYFNGRL